MTYAYDTKAYKLKQALQQEQIGLADIAHNRVLLKRAKNKNNLYSEILDQQQVTASIPKNGVPKVTLVYDESQISNSLGNQCGSVPHNYEANDNNKIIKNKDYAIFFIIIIAVLIFIGVKK